MAAPIAIHGGVHFLGSDPGAQNLDLEHLAIDPIDPNPGRLWYNTTELRVKYAEGITDSGPITIRSFVNDGDLEILLTSQQALTAAVSPIAMLQMTNLNSSPITFGQPLFSVVPLTADLASASNGVTRNVVGLVADASIPAPNGAGNVQASGFLTGTVEQWAAVTGNPAGLNPNMLYFLDLGIGLMTTTPNMDSGNYLCQLGLAYTSTTFLIRIERPIQL